MIITLRPSASALMQPVISTYLDLVRLSAALVVLVVHTCGIGITGGFLWQIGLYGQSAVMVFFVLSGYVIAHVVQTREQDLSSYLTARAARLLSIVVPALLITLLCNEIGSHVISSAYRGPWHTEEPYEYLRYLLTLMMLQDVWNLGLAPTNNGPFWSISFEFVYYLLFAALFFLRGKRRVATALIVLLIGGPTIAAMFPIWLMGWAAYRLHARGMQPLQTYHSILIFVGSFVALLCSPLYRQEADFTALGLNRDSIFGDFLDGALFFVHILVAPNALQAAAGALNRFRAAISSTATLTFALYLFHQPLVRLFAGISPFIQTPGSAANIAFVYLSTFSIVALIGIPAERSKRPIQRWLRQRFPSFGPPNDTGVAQVSR